MKPVLLAVICLAVISHARAACDADPDRIGAAYRIETRDRDGSSVQVEEMILWRSGRRVAHEFRSTRIFDLWEETPNHRVRLARYFDEFQRGIEYEPREIDAEPGDGTWQRKRQLLPDQVFTEERRSAVEGGGCDTLHRYAWEEDAQRYSVLWMPERQLVSEYSAESEDGVVEWKLLRIIDRATEVDAAFAQRDDYQTTDHVDIGDHESDPVLAEMIRRGHIVHPHAHPEPSP